MREAVKTVDYKGFKINIYADESPCDPREWDNVGKMVCSHRGYTLGDVQYKNEFAHSWEENFANYICENEEHGLNFEHRDVHGYLDEDEVQKMWKWIDKNLIVLPLRLYDHSGISMSTSNSYPYNDRWDSGQVGYIYCTKQKALEEWGNKRITDKVIQMAVTCMQGEVSTYSQFIEGDVYGYMIEDADGEEFGGCWGFFGYDEEKSGLLDHAQDEVDCEIEERAEKEKIRQERKDKLYNLVKELKTQGDLQLVIDQDGEKICVCKEREAAIFREKFADTLMIIPIPKLF